MTQLKSSRPSGRDPLSLSLASFAVLGCEVVVGLVPLLVMVV